MLKKERKKLSIHLEKFQVQGVDDTTKIQVGIPFSLYMKAITIINNKRKCENKSSMSNEMSLKNYLAIQVYIFSFLSNIKLN